MDTAPLVSIVIPTYNYAHFLSQAVESALAQTYPNTEVIVVDDGSTDHTRQVLAAYGDRIRYTHQVNKGLSAARNTGIRKARGELIALLDSDDVLYPPRVEAGVSFLRRFPEFGLVASDEDMGAGPAWSGKPLSIADYAEVTLDEAVIRTRFGA